MLAGVWLTSAPGTDESEKRSRRRGADFRSATIPAANPSGRLPPTARQLTPAEVAAVVRRACSPRRCRRPANDRPAWRCAPFPGEHQRRRRRGSLVLRTKSATPAGGCLRHFRSAMGERQSTSSGPFAVTESDCKHAPCRLRINAVANDRRFVALEASGTDETRNPRGGADRIDPTLLRFVHRGRDWRAWAGARSDYESDSGGVLAARHKSGDPQAPS